MIILMTQLFVFFVPPRIVSKLTLVKKRIFNLIIVKVKVSEKSPIT